MSLQELKLDMEKAASLAASAFQELMAFELEIDVKSMGSLHVATGLREAQSRYEIICRKDMAALKERAAGTFSHLNVDTDGKSPEELEDIYSRMSKLATHEIELHTRVKNYRRAERKYKRAAVDYLDMHVETAAFDREISLFNVMVRAAVKKGKSITPKRVIFTSSGFGITPTDMEVRADLDTTTSPEKRAAFLWALLFMLTGDIELEGESFSCFGKEYPSSQLYDPSVYGTRISKIVSLWKRGLKEQKESSPPMWTT